MNRYPCSALKDNGFTVGKTQVVAVEVEDQPGGLHRILEIIKSNDLNVEYMYAYVKHTAKNAIMIFRFDNIAAAIQTLQAQGVTVIDGQRLYAI
ncbi:MAG: hypothetical protein HZB87_12910 [Desulfatitalea sp.]|nr:hypothetical protein [Desulfatitalea sp.]